MEMGLDCEGETSKFEGEKGELRAYDQYPPCTRQHTNQRCAVPGERVCVCAFECLLKKLRAQTHLRHRVLYIYTQI